MGKKYIIELEREEIAYKTVNSNGTPMIQLLAPAPYAEPDMEQVRKEAYDKGYENGFIAGHLKAEKSGQSFYEDGHQRGLNDAWETTRKIWKYDTTTLKAIFGEGVMRMDFFMKFEVSEVIEKIRQ